MSQEEPSSQNMYDLLGFVPEELGEFKDCIAHAKQTINLSDGVAGWLRSIGHEMDAGDRIGFALGVYFAPRIADGLGGLDVWHRMACALRDVSKLVDDDTVSTEEKIECILGRYEIYKLLDQIDAVD